MSVGIRPTLCDVRADVLKQFDIDVRSLAIPQPPLRPASAGVYPAVDGYVKSMTGLIDSLRSGGLSGQQLGVLDSLMRSELWVDPLLIRHEAGADKVEEYSLQPDIAEGGRKLKRTFKGEGSRPSSASELRFLSVEPEAESIRTAVEDMTDEEKLRALMSGYYSVIRSNLGKKWSLAACAPCRPFETTLDKPVLALQHTSISERQASVIADTLPVMIPSPAGCN